MRQTTSTPCDGILVAPVAEEGLWGALRELRAAMQGLSARTAFVSAFGSDGRPASQSGRAALLIAGYHLI